MLPPACCCRSRGFHQRGSTPGWLCEPPHSHPALPVALPWRFPVEMTNLQLSLALGGGHFCMGCATAAGSACEHRCWAGLSSEQWPCTQTSWFMDAQKRTNPSLQHMIPGSKMSLRTKCYQAQKFSDFLLKTGNYLLKAIIKL